MTLIQLGSILQTAMVVLTFSLVVFWILPRYRLDEFRQKLFAVRDEMFDYAASGKISFSDPSYILLRRQMNGLIRYGHQITLFRGLVSAILRRLSASPRDLEWNEAWEASLARIADSEVRATMTGFHDRAIVITVKRLITGSPILMVILALAAMFVLANEGYSGVRQLVRLASRKVLSGPFDPKHIEEDAVCTTA